MACNSYSTCNAKYHFETFKTSPLSLNQYEYEYGTQPNVQNTSPVLSVSVRWISAGTTNWSRKALIWNKKPRTTPLTPRAPQHRPQWRWKPKKTGTRRNGQRVTAFVPPPPPPTAASCPLLPPPPVVSWKRRNALPGTSIPKRIGITCIPWGGGKKPIEPIEPIETNRNQSKPIETNRNQSRVPPKPITSINCDVWVLDADQSSNISSPNTSRRCSLFQVWSGVGVGRDLPTRR